MTRTDAGSCQDSAFKSINGRESGVRKVNCLRIRHSGFLAFTACLTATLLAPPVRAGNISLPPEAIQALDKIYSDDPAAAISIARGIQQSQPEHPLGYLLEAEALWWKRYCAACEVKYGMVEAWKRSKEPEDEAYLKVTDKEINTAQ